LWRSSEYSWLVLRWASRQVTRTMSRTDRNRTNTTDHHLIVKVLNWHKV
jgi:hypothetical protein